MSKYLTTEVTEAFLLLFFLFCFFEKKIKKEAPVDGALLTIEIYHLLYGIRHATKTKVHAQDTGGALFLSLSVRPPHTPTSIYEHQQEF